MNLLEMILGRATSQPQSRQPNTSGMLGPQYADHVRNSGAQALQQQQNFNYSIQDPALQGGNAQQFYAPTVPTGYGMSSNMYQIPGQPPHMEEDYGIGGTDLHQQPNQPNPQQTLGLLQFLNQTRRLH